MNGRFMANNNLFVPEASTFLIKTTDSFFLLVRRVVQVFVIMAGLDEAITVQQKFKKKRTSAIHNSLPTNNI